MLLQGVNFGNLIWDERAMRRRHLLCTCVRSLYGISFREYTNFASNLDHEEDLVSHMEKLGETGRVLPVIVGITARQERSKEHLRDYVLALNVPHTGYAFPIALLVRCRDCDVETLGLSCIIPTLSILREHLTIPLIVGINSALFIRKTLKELPALTDALAVFSSEPGGADLPEWVRECRNTGYSKPIIVRGTFGEGTILNLMSKGGADAFILDGPVRGGLWATRRMVRELNLRYPAATHEAFVGEQMEYRGPPVKLT